MAVACVMSLGVALGALWVMGPAPRVGIRALWVRSNAAEVSVLVGAVILAFGCGLMAVAIGHRRMTVILAGAVALVAAIGWFGEELRLIIRVLVNYRM